MTSRQRYRCRYCGHELQAWLLVPKRPDGAMLLSHLSQRRPEHAGPYLARMAVGSEIGATVAEGFEVVKEDEAR